MSQEASSLSGRAPHQSTLGVTTQNFAMTGPVLSEHAPAVRCVDTDEQQLFIVTEISSTETSIDTRTTMGEHTAPSPTSLRPSGSDVSLTPHCAARAALRRSARTRNSG